MSANQERFIGLDIHKGYMVAAAVDKQQNLLWPPRRIDYQHLERWLTRELQPTDEVVLEAGNNAWTLHDLLQPYVQRVVVAHAAHVKLIASSLIKTDKRDAIALARLLAADLIPPVWVPPVPVRQLRALVQHRAHLVKQRSAVKSQLRAISNRYNLEVPSNHAFAQKHRAWWETIPLPSGERFIVAQNLAVHDYLSERIEAAESQLAQLSGSPAWCAQVACLLQLSGIGMLTAMTILSAIGDIHRFATAKKLVGYSGLNGRIKSSGTTNHGGRITKAGRKELRTALIEAAWTGVQHDSFWKQRFEQLAQRRGRGKAIVAMARKMLVVIWHLLTNQEADKKADPQAVAQRFMRWGGTYHLARSLGLQRTAFVRRELDRLQTGQTVTAVKYSGRICPLPPSGSIPIAA